MSIYFFFSVATALCLFFGLWQAFQKIKEELEANELHILLTLGKLQYSVEWRCSDGEDGDSAFPGHFLHCSKHDHVDIGLTRNCHCRANFDMGTLLLFEMSV